MINIDEKVFGLNLKIEEVIKLKKTARCPYQYIGVDKENFKYLIVIGKTAIQKFYIKRAYTMQKRYKEEYETGFSLNFPILMKDINDEIYVIYKYFEKYLWMTGEKPEKLLHESWENNVKDIQVNDRLVNNCIDEFLLAWPLEIHNKIRNLNTFKEYTTILSSYEKLIIGFEHGDFTTNNVLLTSDGKIWLMDFEFAKEYQPIGSDIYDWHYTTDKKYGNIPYFELNECKHKLMDEINDILDLSYKAKYSVFNVNFKNILKKNK